MSLLAALISFVGRFENVVVKVAIDGSIRILDVEAPGQVKIKLREYLLAQDIS